ncbi:hypothetical protein V1294_002109 [Bradyrhizobium sp. AZCC 1678]
MPLQHVGLAALYGPDFHKDPGQFDSDVAMQIERGLSWRGVEVAAALGASSAISAAFAAFFANLTSFWHRPFPVSPGPWYNLAQK